jgi:hypothetical protein
VALHLEVLALLQEKMLLQEKTLLQAKTLHFLKTAQLFQRLIFKLRPLPIPFQVLLLSVATPIFVDWRASGRISLMPIAALFFFTPA